MTPNLVPAGRDMKIDGRPLELAKKARIVEDRTDLDFYGIFSA